MIKIYVIDTNVLLDAPYALESFEDNAVILPMVVLEELDHFKKAEGEIGVNARKVIRYLDQQRQKGDLTEGVVLESGGTLRVEKNFVDVQLPEDLPVERMDNRILKVCIGLTETGNPGDEGHPASDQGADSWHRSGKFYHRSGVGA